MNKEILMEMPERLLADVDSLRHDFGRFIAEPLERGFGITLGNALRRVLLSSIPGAAITGVQIEGVAHEFSTIPGVYEDVVQIVLNLKQVRFRASSRRSFRCRLERRGVGEVTAADIQCPAGLEVINPDQHIAYLDEEATLIMDLDVEVGHGFRAAEYVKSPDRPIGYIPVDAIFSPVRRANFHVEETRVGQKTDYDRLILEVWTDSSVTPKEALTQAAEILIQHLTLFTDFDETYVEEVEEETPEQRRLRALLDKPVAELELRVRAANCMEAAGIRTVRDLVTRTEKEMLEIKNFGKKSLAEVKAVLEEMGLHFGMKLDDEDK
ncbi:MAG: DNA-directed RNA polymerase subunit alpha [Candidatus Poribacteria bacterium]|nr:MAG: DNA-directed RNA polymerase subunit alpha [Candidatus Poribacteria bacterium]